MQCEAWIISEALVAHRDLLTSAQLLLHCQLREMEQTAPTENTGCGLPGPACFPGESEEREGCQEEGGAGLGSHIAVQEC